MLRQTLVGFVLGVRTLALPWQLWVGLLTVVNAVVPLFFLPRLEAIVVLLGISVAFVAQLVVLRRCGFVRLMGIGHLIAWTPMLAWLALRVDPGAIDTAFAYWLVSLLVIDGTSWIIDVVDVIRYALGDRTPSLTLDEVAPTQPKS